MPKNKTYVRWFDQLSSADVSIVGAKNASVGEMIRALKRKKICVPDDYATTAEAYGQFLQANNLTALILRLHYSPLLLPALRDTLEEMVRHLRRNLRQWYQTIICRGQKRTKSSRPRLEEPRKERRV